MKNPNFDKIVHKILTDYTSKSNLILVSMREDDTTLSITCPFKLSIPLKEYSKATWIGIPNDGEDYQVLSAGDIEELIAFLPVDGLQFLENFSKQN